jgi:hypothetical protein
LKGRYVVSANPSIYVEKANNTMQEDRKIAPTTTPNVQRRLLTNCRYMLKEFMFRNDTRAFYAASLGLCLLAAVMVPGVSASAQVLLNTEGTLYTDGSSVLFIDFARCTSYKIDVQKTGELYPDVGKRLANLDSPTDVIASLQLQPDSPAPGGRSLYYITSISQSKFGQRDARTACTSSTPGGYFEGVFVSYTPPRNGFGEVQILLSGSRYVLLPFTRDTTPQRVGVQIAGKTRVRVYVDNVVGPDGEISRKLVRVAAEP